jgi:hypothetical protein
MMALGQVHGLQDIGDSISKDIRGYADRTSFKTRIFTVTLHLKFCTRFHNV